MFSIFTGIIEEIGKIIKIETYFTNCKIFILANQIIDDLKVGDSIAVNGICVTVSSLNQNIFAVDISSETSSKTNLKMLKKNHFVNLERALMINGRFGGHYITGHIDCVGKIIERIEINSEIIYKIFFPERFTPFVISKGSIAIEGISLTINKVLQNSFSVSIIPYTLHNTILRSKKVGESINLEFDSFGKYIHQFFIFYRNPSKCNLYQHSAISKQYLKKHGFI